ncbi:MAG: protein translocase subunit SecD, partial [Caldilineaceae bacterium]
AARVIVEQRVNGLGVTEPNVQLQGERRIVVELPGISNPEQAINTLRATGQLEFVEPAGAQLAGGMVINTSNHPDAVAQLQEAIAAGEAAVIPTPYEQVFETVMTGDILRTAIATQDQYGQWQIQFDLTSDGSDAFYNYTRDHIGLPLVIVLDGRVLSAPVINAAIRDNGVITGQFSQEEADSLAIQMRYGALPVALSVVDTRTIGASLGQDSVDSSLRAGIIGMSMVLLFMLVLYRLPGLLADMALVMYVALNVAIYKLLPVTLTLPGIAGFLLSIGMAVDANILIFERLKEELRSGRSLRLAVESGFSRAWPAIRDGNLSTLISCAVLYWFGNSFGASIVKGFAITLAIGVGLSMFTAVFVTRTFMRSFLSSRGQKLLESRVMIGQ